MSMIPEPGDAYVKIPLTFDVRPNIKTITKQKIYGALFISILTFLASMCLCFILGFLGFLLGIGITGLVIFFLRVGMLKENYFMQKYKELKETEGVYDYNLFWNIFDIDESKPYICHFSDGLKAIFISLPKDVILGKGEDSEYQHYENVAQAYGYMSKSGISCLHIDYMDIVGKDTRLQQLFDTIEKTKNVDLRKLLYNIFNYIRGIMKEEIASYDVYCFYTRGSDELFLAALDLIISSFHRANYLGHILLNKEDIAELAMAIFNIGDFQVKQMCEGVLESNGSTNFLKLIWTETNGERTQINRTKQEIEAERNVAAAESGVKVKKIKPKDDVEIDL